jgi:hypothetical protein
MAAGASLPQPKAPLISFEDWSRVVREPLIWLGCADPVDTQKKLRTDDPHKSEEVEVFAAWKDEIGVGEDRRLTTKEIVEAIGGELRPSLRSALLHVASKRFSQEIDATALGKWLGAHAGAIASGCKLIRDRADASRPKWYLALPDG